METVSSLMKQIHIKNISFTMIKCRSGEFNMGSPLDEPGRFPDEGQHKVTIGHSFWLGQKPVSQALWCAVMDCGVSCPSDDVAMTKISWDDCREFIDRINHEISCSCVGCFRFPTEAEWEYACRAGSVEPFSGAYRKDGGSVGESLIGCCSENSWGVVDMHGNVSEWCSDCYVSSTTSQCDNQGQEKKVLRGGGRGAGERYCRSACRLYDFPDARRESYGFRLASDGSLKIGQVK